MQIQSNTLGKLEKIRNGTIFATPLTFIREFLQNTQRSKAKRLNVRLDQNILQFKDNGEGCDNPENVFTLDYSKWNSTNEGFGIGFWSCLAIPELQNITVRSGTWRASVDPSEIFNNQNLQIGLETDMPFQTGFTVCLISNWFADKQMDIEDKLEDEAALMPFRTFCNGREIPRKTIYDLYTPSNFYKKINNRIFKGILQVLPDEDFSRLTLMYDGRKIKTSYDYPFVRGTIEIKKEKVRLREPDRTDIIRDAGLYDFEKKLHEEIKKLYKAFIQEEGDIPNEYEDAITSLLEPHEYQNLLRYSSIIVDNFDNADPSNKASAPSKSIYEKSLKMLEDSSQNEPSENSTPKEALPEPETEPESPNSQTDTILSQNEEDEGEVKVPEDAEPALSDHEPKPDTDSFRAESSHAETLSAKQSQPDISQIRHGFEKKDVSIYQTIQPKTDNHASPAKPGGTLYDLADLKNLIRKRKFVTWLNASESTVYEQLKAELKYNGFTILEAPGKVYRCIFETLQIPHISDIHNWYSEETMMKETSLKTKKEETFIGLLQHVCREFDLPANTFLIADLSKTGRFCMGNKAPAIRRIKNTARSIQLYGLTDGRNIYLDRRALNLKNFPIHSSTKIGKYEFQALMNSSETIAHEMAHLLYHTTDNTAFHYQMENDIRSRLISLFIRLQNQPANA